MTKKITLLLADDDSDDRLFFEKALAALAIKTELSYVEDGEKLMHLLKKEHKKLPQVLFLDLNMPRKNGKECLMEIKKNEHLKHLPVIIYSTSLHEDVADILYKNGADFYIKKTDLMELKKVLNYIVTTIDGNNFIRPERDRFVLSSHRYNLPDLLVEQ